MPRNKTRAIEDIDISIALVDFWMSLLIDQCKLNDIVHDRPEIFIIPALVKRYNTAIVIICDILLDLIRLKGLNKCLDLV